MNIQDIHQLFLQCKSVSIDTRKIEPGSIFLAIKGDRFDANTFATEALLKGASYVIIDNSEYYIDARTIVVSDSLQTLQELAQFHRKYLKLPIIALTGSNGKTTTKELIQIVLSKKYRTKATIGNLNNHIGVPLTLLSFDSSTEIGIVEMGANHQKEISFLCEIARPDYGYITNFGKAHLEGFGGVEGVIKGKSEMYTFLATNDKMVFVNLDDPIQLEKTQSIRRHTFGVSNVSADTCIDSVVADPFVTVQFSKVKIESHLIGLYNANNISAAISIGRYFDVGNDTIKEAIESYIPENNRSQLLHKNSNEIILDAYNANPSSMKVAIENFVQLDKKNKIVILGDMFELGSESAAEHKTIVDMLSATDNISCYFVGKDFFQNTIDKKDFSFYDTFDSFTDAVKKVDFRDCMILIKGSRGMALERTLEFI
ncbi:MAG: UDP-N-acetylmuramoyl-tripeptide--D-alanyl-D-alanine ligase [Flavobacterium sp.]|nr:UDP-N-acetylmuramoyl-tripeptide--D-alanyl-D-alanine ligase [Flavobacterium sp.]